MPQPETPNVPFPPIADFPAFFGWVSHRIVPLGDLPAVQAANDRLLAMEVTNARGFVCVGGRWSS